RKRLRITGRRRIAPAKAPDPRGRQKKRPAGRFFSSRNRVRSCGVRTTGTNERKTEPPRTASVVPVNITVARRPAMMKLVVTIAVSACAAGFSDTCAAYSPNIIMPGEVGPGVYGFVDIGDGAQPPLVRPQPVTIVRTRRRTELDPVYVHVPPAHEKK